MISLNSLSISDILKWNNEFVAYFYDSRRTYLQEGCPENEVFESMLKFEDFREGYECYLQCQRILILDEKSKKQKSKNEIRAFVNSNRNEIISSNGGTCFVCGFDYSPILEIHHVLPLKDGGTNSLDNLIALCPNCHRIVHNIESITQKERSNSIFENSIGKWAKENIPTNRTNKLIALGFHCKSLE